MKYIDADKIRAEIERRIEWLNTATNDFAEGRRAELRSLYDFLDTLPDEPVTDCNDLKEAAEKAEGWNGRTRYERG